MELRRSSLGQVEGHYISGDEDEAQAMVVEHAPTFDNAIEVWQEQDGLAGWAQECAHGFVQGLC